MHPLFAAATEQRRMQHNNNKAHCMRRFIAQSSTSAKVRETKGSTSPIMLNVTLLMYERQ
jgi:hypothetical protein